MAEAHVVRPREDHLSALLFEASETSSGRYTPHAFDLTLLGSEQSRDHVVYLHEVHHSMLNDATAWGTALHIFARLPQPDSESFRGLLAECRTTHESFATYSSVEIASTRHGPLRPVLDAYPAYVPLYDSVARSVAEVYGANRQQLVVSAMARLCMQTPILANLADAGVEGFEVAAIRNKDRPDTRWATLLRAGASGAKQAADAADAAVVKLFGIEVLRSDEYGKDLYDATIKEYDAAWEAWEVAAYDSLSQILKAVGATVLPFNGHQDETQAAIERVRRSHGDLGLRAQLPPQSRNEDAMLASAVLQQVRHSFAGSGAVLPAGILPTADFGELVEMVEGQTIIGGKPRLFLDARPSRRLAALYRWPGGALGPPPGNDSIVAVRVIGTSWESAGAGGASLHPDSDDGPGSGDVIWHAILPDPEHLATLLSTWGERGHVVACVSASCLADPAWAARWQEPLAQTEALFIIVDVEPDRFVHRWAAADRTVLTMGIAVDDTAGRRTALVMTPDEGRTYWLVMADDVTVSLVIQVLDGALGDRLRSAPPAFEGIADHLTAVITHELATESFTSFDALSP